MCVFWLTFRCMRTSFLYVGSRFCLCQESLLNNDAQRRLCSSLLNLLQMLLAHLSSRHFFIEPFFQHPSIFIFVYFVLQIGRLRRRTAFTRTGGFPSLFPLGKALLWSLTKEGQKSGDDLSGWMATRLTCKTVSQPSARLLSIGWS